MHLVVKLVTNLVTRCGCKQLPHYLYTQKYHLLQSICCFFEDSSSLPLKCCYLFKLFRAKTTLCDDENVKWVRKSREDENWWAVRRTDGRVCVGFQAESADVGFDQLLLKLFSFTLGLPTALWHRSPALCSDLGFEQPKPKVYNFFVTQVWRRVARSEVSRHRSLHPGRFLSPWLPLTNITSCKRQTRD